jgi:origin recognition complex subunit 6
MKSINNTLQLRLKQTLNLPKIEPRPPCPPRIYSKLYTYLDRTLIVRKRGRLRNSQSTASTATKPVPSRPTPTKASSLAPYKTTPGSASSSRKRGLRFTDAGNDVAVWIPFAARALCKELNAPAAVPHVLAGVTTILTQRSPFLDNCEENLLEDKKDKQPALIAAVYCFVGTRMSGRETNGSEYVAHRTLMLRTLKRFREDEAITERVRKKWNGKKDMEWEGWEDVGPKDVDSWLLHISSRGWLSLDWFENIVEGSGLGPKGNPSRLEDDAALDTEASAADGSKDPQQRGIGTMMQDRVDYLSEKKRAEYKVWKEDVMARIEEMEKEIAQEDTDGSDR